jgi:RND superfamily putative drug exporter
MASGPGAELRMFATALAIGILVAATVIQALIVPAVISLMGRWNWWLPLGRPGSCAWSPRCLHVLQEVSSDRELARAYDRTREASNHA